MVEKIEEIKLLPAAEVKILKELENSNKELYAREIAQEIDYSGQLIGRRAKKLDEDHDLVTREKEEGKPYKYKLTDLGTKFFK